MVAVQKAVTAIPKAATMSRTTTLSRMIGSLATLRLLTLLAPPSRLAGTMSVRKVIPTVGLAAKEGV
jgi:hypothetical protein